MEWLQTGELAAIGTALLWTIAALVWTAAGKYVGALAISFIRLMIASLFLLAHGRIFRGLWLPTDATAETWLLLGLSGFVGFFVADLCLFRAFLLIGPRLTLLVQSLMPPVTALCSWVFLRDRLSPTNWLGMIVTLCGVTWVVLERPDQGNSRDTPRHLRQGIFLAVVAAVGQAVGFVLTKKGIGDYDAVAGTFIRVLGAMVGFALLVSVARHWPAVVAVRHRRAMKIAVFGAFIGPFVGVALSLIAVRECHAGVAATIISTTPVLILPFVIALYREQVSLRAAGGAVLSVVGVALLVLL